MATTITATLDELSGELGVGGVPKMRFGADTSGQPFSFRNKLINGDFSIAQRGPSATSATPSWVYSLDRWRFYGQVATGSATVSQQAFTIGQTDVPDEPTYFIRWNQTVAPAGPVYLTQPIENVRTFAGKTCTVSFWAKAASSTTAFCTLTQSFGSGGSGDVSAAAQTLSLTTTWQKFTKTFTLSSISGKTLGAGHYLDLQFGTAAASTFTIDIAQVQVEAGSIATPFEQRPIQVELAMCQRYLPSFRAETSVDFIPCAGYVSSSTVASFVVNLPVQPRVAPTGMVFSSSIHFTINTAAGGGTVGTLAFSNGSKNSVRIQGDSAGMVAGQGAQLYFNNSAAYLYFTGCEL